MSTRENNRGIKHIVGTRLFAQLAENFGWSIGGASLAYAISGTNGVISLTISMLGLAMFVTFAFNKLLIETTPEWIRRALLWRAASFVSMILGLYFWNIDLVMIGGACSGVYVGIFWPSFYRMFGNEKFKKWYSFEKFSGVILTILSGISLAVIGVGFVLSISFLSVIIAFLISYRIQGPESTNDVYLDSRTPSSVSRTDLIALFEGGFNSSTNLTRSLAILSSMVSISNIPAVVSLGLVIASSLSIGALLSWLSDWVLSDRTTVSVGMLLCLLSCMLMMKEGTWLQGAIALSCGSSIIFPVLKDEVDSNYLIMGLAGRSFREYRRNTGRLLFGLVASFAWLYNPTFIVTTVVILVPLCLLILCYFSDKFSLPRKNLEGKIEKSTINEKEVILRLEN